MYTGPSGASVPAALDEAYAAAIRDDRHDLLSTALCTEMCSELVSEGVENLHFYTLNRAEHTLDLWRSLRLPMPASAAA